MLVFQGGGGTFFPTACSKSHQSHHHVIELFHHGTLAIIERHVRCEVENAPQMIGHQSFGRWSIGIDFESFMKVMCLFNEDVTFLTLCCSLNQYNSAKHSHATGFVSRLLLLTAHLCIPKPYFPSLASLEPPGSFLVGGFNPLEKY